MVSKSSPSISVIIPTFNRITFIQSCILSVKNQTLQPDEIIVVDDGSTDDTWLILERLGFSGIATRKNKFKYIRTDNKGPSSARNEGIKLATSEYIALLDSDDFWKVDKLKDQMTSLKAINYSYKISHTDELWIRNGSQIFPKKKHKKRGGNIFQNCLKLCCVSPSSALIHKTVFSELGYFDEDLLACEDYDFWLRYSASNEFHYVDKPLLIKNGGHPDQLSRKYWGMDRFRVISLEKLLKSQKLKEHQRKEVLEELIFKLNVLMKGAKKRNNVSFFNEIYEKKYLYQCLLEN